MTFASKITLSRIALVPVYALLAIWYGLSVAQGAPAEGVRWAAVGLFVFTAATDGVDGWVARRFNQRSKLGAFLDPLADKTLLITAILFLTLFPWTPADQPTLIWFAFLAIGRDLLIILGIVIVKNRTREVHYEPHWTGKVCTVLQMSVVGWVMLKIDLLPLIWPCALAALFIVWSGARYFIEARRQMAVS